MHNRIKKYVCLAAVGALGVLLLRWMWGYSEVILFDEHVKAVKIGGGKEAFYFMRTDKFPAGAFSLPSNVECVVVGEHSLAALRVDPAMGMRVEQGISYPVLISYLDVPRGIQTAFVTPTKGYVITSSAYASCGVNAGAVTAMEVMRSAAAD